MTTDKIERSVAIQSRQMRSARPLAVLVSALLALVLPARGADGVTNSALQFADLTIEQLMNEPVTSVSKKQTRLNDSPAAVTVMTADDIRRLGITSLPEALRLVPGMDVAQVNSHEWAVSSRGFNNQFANKLLVLVDGRSVYGTGFGGVVWEIQDVVMEDLDRIEVVRGPGGTLWGANAVNGVINIITKSAKDTQGTLISTWGGTIDQPGAAIRYGGKAGTNLYYRAYAKYIRRDGFVLSNGMDSPDNTRQFDGGIRLDWEPNDDNRLTLQGDGYTDRLTENQNFAAVTPPYLSNVNLVNHNVGGNVLGRWTHDFSAHSSLSVQAYYDHFRLEQAGIFENADTLDFDAQHRFGLGERQDVVWGAGYRHISDEFGRSAYVTFNPSQNSEQLFSAFIQDEIAIVPDRLTLTLGTKLEHNDYTGFEVQPSVRLLWKLTDRQTIWAAVSRAVRTPSRSDLDTTANLLAFPPFPPANPFPTPITSSGSLNLMSEDLIAYELGYRAEITKRFSLDVTAFFNDYHRLIAPTSVSTNFVFIPPSGPGYVQIDSRLNNAGAGHTYGFEATARWDAAERWHLMAGYSLLEQHLDVSSPFFGGSPEQQVQLRSMLDLPGNLEWNTAAFFVDRINSPYVIGSTPIQSYIRLDTGIVWHPTRAIEIGVWGQNLLDDRHAEFSSYKTSLITEVPRSVVGKITFRF